MQQASSDGLFDYLRSGSTTRLRQCLEAPEVLVDVAALDNTAHTALPNNNDRNKTFLHYAAEVGDATTVSLLLQKGAAVNATTADGRTPLYLAAYAGQPEAVRALIQGGANVNQAERCSWTPLHRAAQKGHLECVVVLLGAGADVNAVTGKNVTPLHLACEKAKAEIAVVLLQHGADRTIVDRDGKTPQRSVKKWGESKLAHVWSTQAQRPNPQAHPTAHGVTGGAVNPGQHGSAGSAQHPEHQQQHQARHSQQQGQHHEQSQQQQLQHQASTASPELQLQRELELHERLAQERAQGGEYHHSHTGAVEQVRPQQLQEPYPQQPYPQRRDSERSPGAVAGVSAHEAPAPRNPQLVLLQNQSEEDYLRMVAKAAPVAAHDASAASPLPLRHSQPPVAQSQSQSQYQSQSQSQYQSQYQPAPLQPQSSGSTSQPGRSTTKSADFDAIVVGRPGSDDDDDSGSPFPSQRPRSGGALAGPDSRGRQSAPEFQTLPGGLVVGRATSSNSGRGAGTTSTSSTLNTAERPGTSPTYAVEGHGSADLPQVHGRTQRQSEGSARSQGREKFNDIVVGRPGSDDDFDGVTPHRSSVPQAPGDRRGQLLPEPQRVPSNQHREMPDGLVARSADTLERASDHAKFSSAATASRSAQPTRHGSSASPPDQQFNDIVVGRPGSDDDFDGVAPQRSSVPRAPGPPPPPPRGPTVAHPASPNRLFNDTAQLLPEPQRVPSNQHREMPHGLVARSADTLERASDHAKGIAERATRPGYQPPRHGNRPASSPDQFNDIVVGRPGSDSDDDRTSSGQTQARATGSQRGQLLPDPGRVPTNQHREMPHGLVARSADTLERASDHAKGISSAERATRPAYQPSSSSHDIDGRTQRPGRQETTASSGPGTFRHGQESPVTQSSDVMVDRSHRALPPDQRLAKAWAGIDSAQPARESLHRAVRDGDLSGVKRLLEQGANPLLAEATDTYRDGESAIETAYAVENIGALRMMLAVLKHDPPKATPCLANMSSLMTSQQSSAAPSAHGNAVHHAHNNPRTQAQTRPLAGRLPANESELSSIPTLSAGPSATPSSAHGGRW